MKDVKQGQQLDIQDPVSGNVPNTRRMGFIRRL